MHAAALRSGCRLPSARSLQRVARHTSRRCTTAGAAQPPSPPPPSLPRPRPPAPPARPPPRSYTVLAALLWVAGVITLLVGLGEWVDNSVSSLAADFANASGVLSTIEVRAVRRSAACSPCTLQGGAPAAARRPARPAAAAKRRR